MRLIDSNLPIEQVYNKYKVLKIEQVIDLELCKMGFKVHLDDLPENLFATIKCDATGSSFMKLHRYNTRQKKEANLPAVTNRKYHQSVLFQGIKRYSTLPTKLKNITRYSSFIHLLKERYFKQM